MGSAEHSLSSLSIEGSVSTDGESFKGTRGKANYAVADGLNGGLVELFFCFCIQ